jgi:hypothetical protein
MLVNSWIYKAMMGCCPAQDIVVDYVTTMAHTAMDQAGSQGRKLLPEDFLYLVRKASHRHCLPSLILE